MHKLNIRNAVLDDIEDIAAISRLTWDGDDYLEERALGWIMDRSLYAGEVDGKVVGTFRLTPMPKGVLWMEGLRVHKDYQGRGYGRQLGDASVETGKRIIRSGKSRSLEFSTYINNHESIHISKSQGFKVVNRFFLLRKEGIDTSAKIERAEPIQKDFAGLSQHIPVGWKYPRLCPEGIEWALQRCDAFRNGEVMFMKMKNSDEATPVRGAEGDPDGFLDGVEAAAVMAGDSNSCIVLHEMDKSIIERAFDRGYDSWEPVDEYNVLIFRYNI